MAKYRPVFTGIWVCDEKFQDYSPEAKLVFLYLITNEHIEESGIYKITYKTIANETDLSKEKVAELIQGELKNNISYDNDQNVVFVHKFLKFNSSGGNPELMKKSIEKGKHLIKTTLWDDFYKFYTRDLKPLPNGLKRVAVKDKDKVKDKDNIKECSENLPNPPKKEKSNKYKFLKKHLDEAKYLEGAIKETNPKHTIRGKQYLEDWANTFRIMEEKKEASLEEIRIMINFSMGDPFWHSNILSAGKLREQFGRLWEQAKEKGKVKSDLNTGQRTSEQTPEEAEYWKAREAKEKELKKQGLDEETIQSKIAVWSNNYWGARE